MATPTANVGHPEPRFSRAGDRYLEVELGNVMGFDLNVRVHQYAAAIRDARIVGLVELVPEMASLLVSYDPERVAYRDLVVELGRIHAQSASHTVEEMESRLFHVPLLYFDPWTAACVDEYRVAMPEKEVDAEVLCKANGLADRASLQRVHSATEYWVAALGFWPGLCSLMPLDPRCRLHAPKYVVPRSWTPKGTIGLGGGLTSIYPDRTPGGYQIFARTPMPTWDRDQRLHAFKHSPALLRPGDRVRFVPIDRAEYDHIDGEVSAGTYQHPMVDYQRFNVARYRAWVDGVAHGGADVVRA